MIIEYNKLIRDKIPGIIASNGKKAVVDVMDNDMYGRFLDMKLKEELDEYYKEMNTEELVDMVEVIYAILEYKGVSREEFEKIREKKLLEKGGFKERILLKKVIDT